MRCWGFGREGPLGYGNTATIGDDETPGSVAPVDLGLGRSAAAIAAGDFHTCALLDDGSVRCWGFAGNGRLGYGDLVRIGDNETPGSVGPVDLGSTARAITAGGSHTCALLVGGKVRCWGFGSHGQLGNARPGAGGPPEDIGDDEPPASAGPVELGTGRTAVAITAGDLHTCALLDDGSVRCWGLGTSGQLGYGNTSNIGDDETPGSAGPVDLGGSRKAVALSAGSAQTCAVLDDGSVRCWGFGRNGRLGYGNRATIGDDETPGSAGPVNLGLGRTAVAIGVGEGHTCALLDDRHVRCWGVATSGQLGYANTADVGDDEAPGTVGPVDLGAGRGATAISLGARHTCARLDDGGVRCWGYGGNGRLGYCGERNIGDDEPPGAVGPVVLAAPAAGASPCIGWPGARRRSTQARGSLDPLEVEAARGRRLRGCLARLARHARTEGRRVRRLAGGRRVRLRRHARRHKRQLLRRCLTRHGRTPGRVTGLEAHAISTTKIVLSFDAPGSEGSRPPAARSYLVKQSRRPIRSSRGFRRAQALCRGTCRFPTTTRVGGQVTLSVRDLLPRTTYYYAVAARDNVSRRLGQRSSTVRVRTQ